MGGCQNYGPLFGSLLYTAPRIEGTQKGTIIFDNHPYYESVSISISPLIWAPQKGP